MAEYAQDTVVQTENVAPVTDSAQPVDNTVTDTKSDNITTPSVEMRDGKMFVDGVRVYTRDDTNKIAANAKRDVESSILQELNVDSIDSVKSVVKTLQETTPTSEGESSLNVNALRDAVKKREATVEELKAQVNSLKTDLLLKDHMGQLQNAMPSAWSADQKSAVIDLMRARNMIAVEGDTFALRSGDSYLTVDGETPDYTAAVEMMGKNLGLQFGKKGVDIQYGETSTDTTSANKVKPLDESRLTSDAEYRSAYMSIRQYQPTLSRDKITDNLVKKQMEKRSNKIN
jgi:hypothetical protein